jgi:hypothetical protein
MNRYQLWVKYGWAFSHDMPDRYIKRKGFIGNEIAGRRRGPSSKAPKRKRKPRKKMEMLEREYNKVKKVLEFMMPLFESMDEDWKRKAFEKRKGQIIMGNHYLDSRGVNAET